MLDDMFGVERLSKTSAYSMNSMLISILRIKQTVIPTACGRRVQFSSIFVKFGIDSSCCKVA